ncbi:AAA family ATPase [Wenzhouxiangella sp. EGI_FJ10409]|uniref:AAA family ATPase n=1 Tax=Wenzhouxiangella sp. EGI_FJ10409 TaxID=3243767 RepID=UPI0035DAEEE1
MAEAGRRILIIAGPNGAGKTTFAREYLLQEANCPVFVNADLIAAGLSPFRPESVAFQAGRLMLAEIARHAAAGISFGFETTLSGRGYARMIPRWQDDGYRVKLIFLQLDRPETAIARVAERVRQGGHDVPEETIRRRFHAGKNNFASLYRHLVDSWALYDNSGEGPELKEWSSRHD